DEVAVAILYPCGPPLLRHRRRVAHLRPVGRTQQEAGAAGDQLQVGGVAGLVGARSAHLTQLDAAARRGDEHVDVPADLRVEVWPLDGREAQPEAGARRAAVFVEVGVRAGARPRQRRVGEAQAEV